MRLVIPLIVNKLLMLVNHVYITQVFSLLLFKELHK